MVVERIDVSSRIIEDSPQKAIKIAFKNIVR